MTNLFFKAMNKIKQKIFFKFLKIINIFKWMIYIYRERIIWDEWFIMRVRVANLGHITIHKWLRFKVV